ncbi:SRPBCC family protein [Mycolicibacterium gilvum]|uniref:Polyketide cyclase / dehydrase and lipid transport n=1 Tax=Mycolicibacterium gilvum (strain DSM 45189 / LMG 24558 / Spyr1) TaxID=278137 RepID=E6TKW7_MYCSR|nr:SRPBCC family protein [Mycolicibacterium gilvum]ADT98125.1 Polyketide cyclase / dehydrase and lipid transport [Mycolicibacterium gilvum Spyr1]
MPTAHVMEQSRAIPVDVDTAFRHTLPMPLPTLFSRWYGPISPVKQVRDQTGDWGTVGQTRTVVQVGGGSMREELTLLDPPRAFGYTLSGVTGPLAPLVDHIDGQWHFAPVGTGTEVTWRWTVYPRNAVAGLAMPGFARLWRGFARVSLGQLSNELLRR